MQYYEVEYAPEHLIVKGAIVKQPKGRYMMGIKSYELPIDLPSGRIIAITYKSCRELPDKDGNIIYDPHDIKDVLIDFGWLGMIDTTGLSLVVSEGRLVCLACAG